MGLSNQNNYKKVSIILWVILFANVGVAVLKIVVGGMIKSASMTADGFHSLSDGSSNVVGLIGIKYACKPVDEDHPYGHKKFETLSGLFIAAMLFFVAAKITIESFLRIFSPVKPEISLESFAVLVGTLIINIIVVRYEYKQGKLLNSEILISDSTHTKSDIYITIGVLVTLISIKLGFPIIIDPIASFVVAGFIFYASYKIFKSTSDVLVDRTVVDSCKIKEIVMSFDQVKDAHGIRSRGREDDVYIDLHILIDPCMTIEEAHDLNHKIEEKIRQGLSINAEAIIHSEPYHENET